MSVVSLAGQIGMLQESIVSAKMQALKDHSTGASVVNCLCAAFCMPNDMWKVEETGVFIVESQIRHLTISGRIVTCQK